MDKAIRSHLHKFRTKDVRLKIKWPYRNLEGSDGFVHTSLLDFLQCINLSRDLEKLTLIGSDFVLIKILFSGLI